MTDERFNNASTAHPPVHRASMLPRPWAGHPLLRPLRRLLGYRAPDHRRPDDARPLMLRRVALLVLVALGAVVGTDTMIDVLPLHGQSWAEQGLLLLFGVLFAWISAGFWTGVMGTWVLLRGRDRDAVTNHLRGPAVPIPTDARTAIIMPICNEDVATVFGGLRATYESLARTDARDRFDFFVLSDTNDPDLRTAEQVAWVRWPRRSGATANRSASTTAGASTAASARPATSPTSAAAGGVTTATWSCSTPTAS